MLEIDPYRSELNKIISDLKLTYNDILLFARSDLSKDLTKGDTFLFLTKDTLVIIEGQIRLLGQSKSGIRRDHLRSIYEKKRIDTYELCDLSELALEELISTARLTVKCGEKTLFLAMLTNASKESARLFVKYANQYKKDGKIEKDEEDFKKDAFCPTCHCRYPDANRKICPKCMDRSKKHLGKGFDLRVP